MDEPSIVGYEVLGRLRVSKRFRAFRASKRAPEGVRRGTLYLMADEVRRPDLFIETVDAIRAEWPFATDSHRDVLLPEAQLWTDRPFFFLPDVLPVAASVRTLNRAAFAALSAQLRWLEQFHPPGGQQSFAHGDLRKERIALFDAEQPLLIAPGWVAAADYARGQSLSHARGDDKWHLGKLWLQESDRSFVPDGMEPEQKDVVQKLKARPVPAEAPKASPKAAAAPAARVVAPAQPPRETLATPAPMQRPEAATEPPPPARTPDAPRARPAARAPEPAAARPARTPESPRGRPVAPESLPASAAPARAAPPSLPEPVVRQQPPVRPQPILSPAPMRQVAVAAPPSEPAQSPVATPPALQVAPERQEPPPLPPIEQSAPPVPLYQPPPAAAHAPSVPPPMPPLHPAHAPTELAIPSVTPPPELVQNPPPAAAPAPRSSKAAIVAILIVMVLLTVVAAFLFKR